MLSIYLLYLPCLTQNDCYPIYRATMEQSYSSSHSCYVQCCQYDQGLFTCCPVWSHKMSRHRCEKSLFPTRSHSNHRIFMPTLSYRTTAILLKEQQWNKAIRPAIRATCNAASMAKNIAHAVLYGPLEYQGIAVKNPYFFQGIIHIIAFLNEATCNSSTG